ncbi:MAG TPA: hypothetical protein VHL11_18005, partial [Phototrophicaceae bacterium]|nr:hypothetical protein [Phototrophicaceae bacterium]
MKRISPSLLLSILIMALMSGLALSQSSTSGSNPETTAEVEAKPGTAFKIEGEIGRALPRKMVYDPVQERMAVVDAYNRLLLINALDYSTQAVLHESGEYSDIAFSHDGHWLVVSYGITMELWDAETGTLVANLDDLGRARQLVGPMVYSSDDQMLIFYGIYPAPRALRVTETDSIIYPWVWNLKAARQEAPSTLPGGV